MDSVGSVFYRNTHRVLIHELVNLTLEGGNSVSCCFIFLRSYSHASLHQHRLDSAAASDHREVDCAVRQDHPLPSQTPTLKQGDRGQRELLPSHGEGRRRCIKQGGRWRQVEIEVALETDYTLTPLCGVAFFTLC